MLQQSTLHAQQQKNNNAKQPETAVIKPAPAITLPDDPAAEAAQYQAAQPPKPVVSDDDEVSHAADEMPEMGFDLNRYLSENIKYPPKAFKDHIQGRVVVRFVVTKTGTIKNATVTESLSPELDAEALRVINAMPTWSKPAMNNGKAVGVNYIVPIKFWIK